MRSRPADPIAVRPSASLRLRFCTLSIVFALAACASDQKSVGEGSVGYRKLAAARYAELDPRLRPDWTSRHHFPPEYCWYVVDMNQAHPLYWDIRRFCDAKRGRGRFR